MIRPSQIEFSVSAGSCILGALALLVLPLKLLLSALLAAAFHEFCHLAALALCGVQIRRLRIEFSGASIETEPVPPLPELLCAAAGPLGSFLCLLVVRRFPVFALCGFLQGCYNLLPVFPMDGGRILRCFLLLMAPEKAEGVSRAVGAVFCTVLIGGCIVLFFRSRQALFLLLGGYFLCSIGRSGKIPCKREQDWVQ